MIYTEKSCKKFIEAAASKEPVPGGGSVAALAGALGTSLGHMVGALTVGKKKYADVEDEMMELMKEGRRCSVNFWIWCRRISICSSPCLSCIL